MCRRAAIPYNLKDAAAFLNIEHQKVEAGIVLIKLFSMPTDRTPPPDAWEEFCHYCRVDVLASREIYHRLKKSFPLDDGFLFDVRMNERGIPVNLDALAHAEGLVGTALIELRTEFAKITGLLPTQRDRVLAWLQERGYPSDNLQALTMERVLDDPPEEMSVDAVRALELRAGGAFAALAKIPVMRASACSDSRVRGVFLWSGALRTHRWSGKIIQPQNFKRPTVKQTELAYAMIKQGCDVDDLLMSFDSLPETIASSVRHFIELPGREFLDGDYSNIEGRVAPWLAGQDDLLDAFRLYDRKLTELGKKAAKDFDVYVAMASKIFRIKPQDVNSDQRWVGKTLVLGAMYGIGARKFKKTCDENGQKLGKEECESIISRYRELNDQIVATWKRLEEAVKNAIRNPGSRYKVNGKIEYYYGSFGTAGFHALCCVLPSGHKLVYPLARLKTVPKKFDGREEVMMEEIQYWAKERFVVGWGWQGTYRSKLFENCVQAIAGDFLTHGLLNAERQGFNIFACIHDQALAVKEPHQTPEQFKEAMCQLPPWAEDFPLEASCSVTPFYQKDT
jgi:DNA polymerase